MGKERCKGIALLSNSLIKSTEKHSDCLKAFLQMWKEKPHLGEAHRKEKEGKSIHLDPSSLSFRISQDSPVPFLVSQGSPNGELSFCIIQPVAALKRKMLSLELCVAFCPNPHREDLELWLLHGS